MRNQKLRMLIAGAAAGAVNGLLGAGGGMLLVPLLTMLKCTEERDVFPTSVAIILPICLVSLAIEPGFSALPLREAWPYLLGGTVGGLCALPAAKKIPVKWLHRALGLLILWGGIRYLC
jgi:uncharacterized membrane protein YfcA